MYKLKDYWVFLAVLALGATPKAHGASMSCGAECKKENGAFGPAYDKCMQFCSEEKNKEGRRAS